MLQRAHLKEVSIFVSSAPSGHHTHTGGISLPVAGGLVQVLGLDEVQAFIDARGLKFDKVEVA